MTLEICHKHSTEFVAADGCQECSRIAEFHRRCVRALQIDETGDAAEYTTTEFRGREAAFLEKVRSR